jgi:hypothetical protein
MRTQVIAAALGVLVGLGAGLAASSDVHVFGTLTAEPHEVEEGYFAIGTDSYLVLKPGSPAHEWMRERVGQRLTVTVSAAGPLTAAR